MSDQTVPKLASRQLREHIVRLLPRPVGALIHARRDRVYQNAPHGGTAMADEHYIVMTVECPRCKTKQKLHVAARTGVGRMGSQTIPCIKCEKDFDVMVPDKMLRGPFPA